MNLSDITTKGWILALFVRDDGERLLLGDGWFDFKDSLQHFQANTIANDVVELQGTDGQLLAGQVQRSGAQTFEGYVGDNTISQTEIEKRRRQFLQFFQIRRFYKVVYIFPDGTAIDRKRGYLVEAPTIPEMWQKFPEYHVALNFENANYYEYAENAEGDEIFANTSMVKLANIMSGGLVWDADGAVTYGYIWLDPQTLSGDYILINGGIEGSPLTLSQLTGNAEQTTYSGKNLLSPTPYRTGAGYYNASAGADMSPATSTYVTTSVSGDKVSIVCTATWVGAMFIVEVQEGQSYHLHYHQKGTGARSTTYTLDSSYAVVRNTGNAANDDYTRDGNITVESGEKYIAIGIGCGNPASTITVEQLQVELGSSYTGWQEYVGGTPAPNPQFPQPISTVTGEQVIKVVGKNLIRLANNSGSATFGGTAPNNVTITVLDDYTFKLNGTATNNGWIELLDASRFLQSIQTSTTVITPLQSDKTYSISAQLISGTFTQSGSASGFNIQTTSANAQKGCAYNGSTSFTGADGVYRGWLRVSSGDTFNDAIFGIQLELGTATAYEPYQGQEFEINLGKNLFDKSTITTGKRLGSDGSLVSDSSFFTSDYITITPSETYAYSRGATGSANSAICFFDSSKTFISRTMPIITSTVLSGTVTTPATAYYARLCEKNDSLDTAQLERGAVATSYAPYFTPIELAGVGEIQADGLPKYHDTIKPVGDKWYIEKQVGKVVLDGTEGWSYVTLNNGYFQTSYSLSNLVAFDGTNALCDHFTPRTRYAVATATTNDLSINLNGTYCAIRYQAYTDADVFKTWLASNPTTVYYALATPTTTEITDETLLSQLNFVASLYGGVNNISIVPTGGAQGQITIQYYADVDTTQAGYEWEEGAGGGATNITVQGIANAQPIWTVTGPAINPTLTNVTTGQSITWTGTVPSGQKLVIDMDEQTAKLSGANVYANISGTWIELKPGTNRLTYVAGGGAEAPSKIEWNGVVG